MRLNKGLLARWILLRGVVDTEALCEAQSAPVPAFTGSNPASTFGLESAVNDGKDPVIIACRAKILR
jgi:hypothetical protein